MKKSDLQTDISENGSYDPSTKKHFLVVGIGASAGGIQALKAFFEKVPGDSGMAYVVILHLSPDFDSQLAIILQTVASIPVIKVVENAKIEPDHVYVISPNTSLKMWDDNILCEPIKTTEERRAPVDIFFRTLAESHQAHALAVILSGTGANGSMGLKRIKEKGGIVLVQNPYEAEYADMPRHAIATQLVDEVMNVVDIPAKILAYKKRFGTIEIPVLQQELEETAQAALRTIFSQLRIRTGHDFSNYKRATMLRRIERRINVHNLDSLAAYAAFLKETPEEIQGLLKDLLISVTNFFRDKEAFYFLETDIIPKIIESKPADTQIRIWITGCATGEEAYSVAMLISEKLFDSTDSKQVQIFATDIDDAAIATAREGFYTLNDAADVSNERLHRFFVKETGGYRVKKELREMVLFAKHNVMNDPPFSHVDLVTCRNMLIYFNQSAQNKVMETFHFSLIPGGYLFIGSSESVDGAIDLYVPVSKENHVFQSRHATPRPIPLLEPSFSSAGHLSHPPAEIRKFGIGNGAEGKALERISLGDLHQRLLEEYAPPSIIINENFELMHLSEKAGRFLHVHGGEPSNNILLMIKPELRLELRTAVYEAIQQSRSVKIKNLTIGIENKTEFINLYVRPVLRSDDTARGFLLLIFETIDEKEVADVIEILPGTPESLTFQLDEENTKLKLKLRSANEYFEVQSEELRASNEELQAMNEELRTAAEELETSKEELQSINEELITVNQELKIKIDQVSQSNNDFKNLINSTDIGTIFLDRNFSIKLFTPAVSEIFNLIRADIGRPLSDITSQLEYTNLLQDAKMVLQKLKTIEREVSTKNGRTYLMQLLPYRTEEDRINGVIINFVNITQRRKAEDALRESEQRFRLLIESATDYAIFSLTPEGIINSWNTGAQTLFGWTENEVIGKGFDVLFAPEDRAAKAYEQEMKTALENGRAPDERFHVKKDGSRFYVSGVMTVLKDTAGKTVLGFVKIARDMSEQLESERAMKESEERLRLATEAADMYSWEYNVKTKEYSFSANAASILGINEDALPRTEEDTLKIIHPDDKLLIQDTLANAIQTRKGFSVDIRSRTKTGSMVWLSVQSIVVCDTDNQPARIIGIAQNVSERKQTAEALIKSEERYRIALEAGELATWDWNLVTNKVAWNEQHFRLFGIEHEEDIIEPEYFLEFIYPEDLAYVKKQLAEVVGKSGIYQAEFRIRRKDNGKLRWMSGYGRVTERNNDKATRVSGVMFDTTERREAEDNLKAARNSLTTALEAANMGVWTMDLLYGYMDRSTKHDLLLGYTAWQEEWNTEKAKQFIIEEDKPKFEEAYNNLLTNGIFKLEARVRQPNGSTWWIYYYGRSFVGEEGKADQAAGVIFDITDRKTIEQQKDEFIGIASHELKTPITSIKAYAGILQEIFTTADDHTSATMMMKLDAQVDRLTKLIKDLLDVTKVSEGQLQLTPELFNIETMVKNVIEDMQPTTRQHSIVLDMSSLPDVTGDEERLSQVLTNLISNAVKYSSDSNEIKVTANHKNGAITVSVQDFGIGMSEATVSKVFERFFRSYDPDSRSYPGLGLGLYISMEIMKRHGGTIKIASEKGKGSVFTMILPV